MKRSLALLFIFGPLASAQFLSVGFKGGVPLNDAYSKITNPIPDLTQSTSTHPYILGASVEVHLPLRLGVEADVLYRSSAYHYSYQILNTPLNIQNTVRNLEVPILLKWEVTPGPIRPFVEGGVSYRHLYVTNRGVAASPDSAGGTVGAGILFKAGPLRIAPEVRYTRWASTAILAPSFQSVRNQSDFFLGFRF